MTAPLRVLLVEDSPTDAKLVIHELRSGAQSVEFERVETAEAMRASLAQGGWDIVISDWSMPRFSALGALEVLRATEPDLPFIIVSGTIGEDTAVEAMRAGARDYVLKDKLGRLTPAVARELREHRERVARRKVEAALREALHQSEEQLRQAQKMEAVGRLAGGIAHDFNNVLSVILSYAELLLESLTSADPLRVDIEQIRNAALRAEGLTRQLLMFSRQQVADAKVVDLNEVLLGMDKLIERILGEDVELVLVLGTAPARIKIDPTHIEQLILNLVVNARDAMPNGGKLALETTLVELDAEDANAKFPAKGGSYVVLVASDSGTGMDRATQARIFEPFFTTKEMGKGTGLGLSTVFGIVQRGGGNIWVDSEPGQGTTFKIYLPRVEAEIDGPKQQVEPKTLTGNETILLVEDEEQVRKIVFSALRRQGYRVLAAQSGSEALQLSADHPEPIDLLLTDVVMPQMSGPELAQRLAQTRPDMKVLCMSGYTDDSSVRHGVLDAGVAFIQKPVTPTSLSRRVRELLDDPSALGKRSP